ncbi:MAG: hypothetical protein AAGE01_06870 [Pseudomonadota bacterium]
MSRRRILALAGSLLLLAAGSACGCSCSRDALPAAYAGADHVVVGKVTEASRSERELIWSIEVLERFKGRGDRHLLRYDYPDSPCAPALAVGDENLFFIDGQAITRCSFQPAGKDGSVGLLRDFRDGRIDVLAEPWYELYGDGECTLAHQPVRDGRGFATVGLRASTAAAADPHPAIYVSLRRNPTTTYHLGETLARPSLRLDVPPNSWTLVEDADGSRSGAGTTTFWLAGDLVTDILDALAIADEYRLTLHEFEEQTATLTVEAPIYDGAALVSRFERCRETLPPSPRPGN